MAKDKLAEKVSIQSLVASVNKKYGAGTLLPAADAVALVIDRIPTGILDLDVKLGGGIPRGRITMLKGEWSTGKSAICFKVAAEAQRHCRFCGTRFEKVNFLGEVFSDTCLCGRNEPMRVVWMDAEHSFESSWAEKWGITVEDILLIETEYAEQAIDVADACIRSKECDLLIVDSVAALTPGVEVTESVSGDSLVFIQDKKTGSIRYTDIESACELFNKDSPCRTLSYDSEQGFHWGDVAKIWKSSENPERKMFKIKTSYGRTLKITGDHSVYRLRLGPRRADSSNVRICDSELELTTGKDLQVGDYMLLADYLPLTESIHSWRLAESQIITGSPYNQCHVAHESLLPQIAEDSRISGHRYRHREGAYGPHLPLRFVANPPEDSKLYYTGAPSWARAQIPVENIAYLVGAYLGDGYVGQEQIVLYVGNTRHEQIFEEITRDLSGYVFPLPGLNIRNEGTDYLLHIGCRSLGLKFSSLFSEQDALSKRFPDEVWGWSTFSQRRLIEGWLATDGHIVPKDERAMITTCSYGMALDGATLLGHLGVDAGVQIRRSSGAWLKGRWIPPSLAYSVTFSMRAFRGENDGKFGRRNPTIRVPFGVPVEVRSIEEIPSEPVYDISVTGPENFVANGILVHNSSEKWQMGVMARLMNKALRKWTSGLNSYGLLGQTKCTILMVNQLRVGIGGYHPTTTSPGGKGLDFFQSVEVRFKRESYLEEPKTERPVGIKVEFNIKKNKTAPPAPPGGKFSLYFVPSPGKYSVGATDTDAQALRLALYWGIIIKGGAWFNFPDGTKYQGKLGAEQALRQNPKLLEDICSRIRSKELTWVSTGEGAGTGTSIESEDEEE